MKIIALLFLGILTLGCSHVGSYAGMDLNVGYGHNFGDNGGGGKFAGHFYDGGNLFPQDTISTGVTILLRKEE